MIFFLYFFFQILREIKFREFKISNLAFLAVLEAMNFGFGKIGHFFKAEIIQKQILEPLKMAEKIVKFPRCVWDNTG